MGKDDLQVRDRGERGPRTEREDSKDRAREKERWAARLREAEVIAALLKESGTRR